MATTYAALQTEVLAWLRNSAVTDQVTNLISQVEDEIDAKTRGVRRLATTTLSIDDSSQALPSDFQDVRSLRITTAGYERVLVAVSAEDMAAARAYSIATSTPLSYSVMGSNFEFDPAPDRTYAATLDYTARLARLSNTNTTNWVLDEFPTVYLNGALARGYLYLKNAEMAAMYRGLFLEGLAELRGANRTVYAPQLRSDVPVTRRSFDIVRG